MTRCFFFFFWVCSYTAPAISALSAPATLATAGGEYVTLTGTNFGPASVSERERERSLFDTESTHSPVLFGWHTPHNFFSVILRQHAPALIR